MTRLVRTTCGFLALAFVAVACASTSGKGGASAQAGAGSETGTAQSPVKPASGGTVGSMPGVPGSVAGQPGAPQPGSPSSATSGGASAQGQRVTPVGRGITAKEVRVGFWFLASETACGAIGASGQAGCGTDNDDAEIAAVIKWVNAHGGIAGRKLVAEIFHTDSINGTWSSQAQAACSHFSEDKEVFIAVSEGDAGRPFLAPCLAKKGIPTIEPGFWAWDKKSYEELHGFLYQPQRASPNRWVASYIDGLYAQGFFKKDSKIGLFRYDSAPYTRVTESVLKPHLARYGLKLTDEAIIKTPPSVGGFGEENSEISSAILRMKEKDVDRVIFFTTMAEFSLFYFPQARAQDFNPRYGVSSLEYLDFMDDSAPPEQLRGTIGIGWAPDYDVLDTNDPGGTARTKLCERIMKDAGQSPNAGRNAKCDTVFFIRDALELALARGLGLNVEGFRLAVESFGTSFVPAHTFATKFGPGRYDGPAAYRNVAYFENCRCFKYTSGNKPMP